VIAGSSGDLGLSDVLEHAAKKTNEAAVSSRRVKAQFVCIT
jgi:hypothetical protein